MGLTNVNKDGLGDQSVDLTKLPHGDTNSDGKFLRSNNGADPTWETVDQTTIPVTDESSDTTCFPVFTTGATGDQAPKTGDNLQFNSSTGLLRSTHIGTIASGGLITAYGVATGGGETEACSLTSTGVNISATTSGPCDLRFGGTTGSDYVAFKSDGAFSGQTTFILPDGDGSADQVLKTDGGGNLDWTTIDNTDIRKDISKLALQIAVDTNRAAYNLTNSFIDQFEDDSGLATQTNCDRTTDEYMTTIIDSWGTDTEWKEGDLDSNRIGGLNTTGFSPATLIDGVHGNDQYGMYINSPSSYNGGIYYEIGADSDFGVKTKVTGVRWCNSNTSGRFQYWKVAVSNDGTNYTYQNFTAGDSSSGGSPIGTAGNSDTFNRATLSTPFLATAATSKIKITFDGYYNNGNANAGMSEFRLYAQKYTGTANATGTVISTTSTADSSRTKVSGVILYKDNAGTAALGTDLKVSFSCDNGSNWTALDATSGNYTAGSNFSSGIKTAYIKEVTCTAGTQVKYKVEWANQASGSKETQLHGIGVNY